MWGTEVNARDAGRKSVSKTLCRGIVTYTVRHFTLGVIGATKRMTRSGSEDRGVNPNGKSFAGLTPESEGL